jgi:hypothetical protein
MKDAVISMNVILRTAVFAGRRTNAVFGGADAVSRIAWVLRFAQDDKASWDGDGVSCLAETRFQ